MPPIITKPQPPVDRTKIRYPTMFMDAVIIPVDPRAEQIRKKVEISIWPTDEDLIRVAKEFVAPDVLEWRSIGAASVYHPLMKRGTGRAFMLFDNRSDLLVPNGTAMKIRDALHPAGHLGGLPPICGTVLMLSQPLDFEQPDDFNFNQVGRIEKRIYAMGPERETHFDANGAERHFLCEGYEYEERSREAACDHCGSSAASEGYTVAFRDRYCEIFKLGDLDVPDEQIVWDRGEFCSEDCFRQFRGFPSGEEC